MLQAGMCPLVLGRQSFLPEALGFTIRSLGGSALVGKERGIANYADLGIRVPSVPCFINHIPLNPLVVVGWHNHCQPLSVVLSALTVFSMLTDIWYLTKSLQITAGVTFVAGTTMLIAPGMGSTNPPDRSQTSIERKQVRILPVALPQGRLLCVQGVVMHQRMYPRGMEPISPADAIEIAATVADEACARSAQATGCKAAQSELTSLRRALRSCNG